MARKSAAFSAAPPIRPPSISGWASNSLAFSGFMLPPYRICMPAADAASFFATRARSSAWTSGAISGVLGGYILLHPSRRVTVILFRFLTQVPAYVAIGLWFVFQLISGLGMLGGGSQQGGVAYAAHIGGFIAGLVLIKFFDIGHRNRAAPGY